MQTTSSPTLGKTMSKVLTHPRTRSLAKNWVKGLTGIASLIEVNFISIALGFTAPLKNGFAGPIVTFVQSRPFPALLIGALLIAVSYLSWRLAEEHHEEARREQQTSAQGQTQAAANGGQPSATGTEANGSSGNTSPPPARNARVFGYTVPLPALALAVVAVTSGYLLFFGFVGVALAKPGWCPDWLCASRTVANSTYDDHLELYWQTFQSPSYVIPGNPVAATARSVTTAQTQASGIGALREDQSPPDTYRVVIGAQNRQGTGYPIRIEQVTLVVVAVPPSPQPLNVTAPTAGLRSYASNPYLAIYSGQRAGAQLPATYTLVPGGHVELAPNESDALDIQLTSKVPAEVQYRVQVTYRSANESQLHTLTLRQVFTVVFADGANWHPWTLQEGRLVPQP